MIGIIVVDWIGMHDIHMIVTQGSYTFLLSKIKDFSRTFQDKN